MIIIIIIILKETNLIKIIIQIDKDKVKCIITACIPTIIIIFFLLFIKKNYNFFCLLNIRMVNPTLNLSLNELRLINSRTEIQVTMKTNLQKI